jgi:hypothetical protein
MGTMSTVQEPIISLTRLPSNTIIINKAIATFENDHANCLWVQTFIEPNLTMQRIVVLCTAHSKGLYYDWAEA